MRSDPAAEDEKRDLAKAIVLQCFRNNTPLEGLHAGPQPLPGAVVETPEGPVDFRDVSRFSDQEMKALTAEAANNVFSVLVHLDDPDFRRKFIQRSLGDVREWRDPVRSNDIEALAGSPWTLATPEPERPSFALVLEAALTLRSTSSPVLVFETRGDFEAAATLSYDRRYATLRQLPRGGAKKRKYPSFFGDLLSGAISLLDPEGEPLHGRRGIGSLVGPTDAAWRSGKGPAADLTTAQLFEFLKDPASGICASGDHFPVVLAASKDGWLRSSRLADAPGSDDAARTEACLNAASNLEPTALCLVDYTGVETNRRLLLVFVSGNNSEMIDVDADERGYMAAMARNQPLDEGRAERDEAVRRQLERADLFLKRASRLFG